MRAQPCSGAERGESRVWGVRVQAFGLAMEGGADATAPKTKSKGETWN
jgi:hypothetical protein